MADFFNNAMAANRTDRWPTVIFFDIYLEKAHFAEIKPLQEQPAIEALLKQIETLAHTNKRDWYNPPNPRGEVCVYLSQNDKKPLWQITFEYVDNAVATSSVGFIKFRYFKP